MFTYFSVYFCDADIYSYLLLYKLRLRSYSTSTVLISSHVVIAKVLGPSTLKARSKAIGSDAKAFKLVFYCKMSYVILCNSLFQTLSW